MNINRKLNEDDHMKSVIDVRSRSTTTEETEYVLVGKDLLTNVLMLDIGYRLQTFTIELQSAAFAFILADRKKTQQVANHFLGNTIRKSMNENCSNMFFRGSFTHHQQ